jgi:amidohydrolase
VTAAALRERALAALDAAAADLISLSEAIHADPELSFDEVRAAERVATFLEERGFQVTRGTAGMPTAFTAVTGAAPGALVLGLMAEYDALPAVGHACGHNLIAASSVGAALALAPIATELGLEVRVYGTPAEEGGGGKILLLDAGVFDDLSLALMVHPWSFDRLESACLAVDHFDVTFTGRTAHASAAPWQGHNAGDAMTIAQVALGLLRQQLPAGDQIHGIVTDGGEAANVIPSHVTGRFMCRSTSKDGLAALIPRVAACFEAGALATETTVAIEQLAPLYSHMEQDAELLASYRRHAEALGRTFDDDDAGVARPTYSTDMANVSLAVPSIHPLIDVGADGAVNHQPEFTAACVGPAAERALLDAASAMASVAIDAATDEALRSRLASPRR